MYHASEIMGMWEMWNQFNSSTSLIGSGHAVELQLG